VEPSTDNLYVNTVQNIEEYGPHGEPFEKPIARFAAESEGEGTIKGESYGIAVDGTSGDIYFPDGAGHISVFGPGVFVPEVTLDPPSNIEKTKATVSGTVNPDGVPVTSCAFEYGPKYARSVPCPASPGSGSSPVAETVELTGLEPSQEYEVRLSAGNAQGKNYRYQKFTTLGPPTVSVPELVARATTKTAATLHGQIVSSNGFDTTYYFEYGPTTAYGTSVPVPSVDIGTVKGIPVEATVTGLTPGTEYHARLVATNSAGTTYSEDRAFRTVPVAAIQSEHVVNIGLEEATLQALIGPLGDDTLYHFEYGPTSAYGSTVPLYDADVGVGSLKENLLQRELVAQRIGGLRPGTVYHYRAVATNALGTAYGEDRTFTTLPSATAAPADTCPNAALRTGLSADLPDCRAYEMVSPLDKNGGSVGGAGFNDVQASVDGEGVAYTANTGFADAVGSGYVGSVVYVGSRGPSGWVTHAVTPTPPKASFQAIQEATRTLYFSSDLSSSLLFGFRLPGADLGTGLQDLYRENTADRGLETVTLTDNPEPNACNCVREFYSQETVGYSSDMGVIVFETAANLLPETSGPHLKLYEWDHGVLRVAGRLPDGSIAGGAKGPFDKAPFGENTETLPLESVRGAVSSDGKKVLFYSPVDNSPQRQLYMRKDGSSTVWLSRSWTSTPNPEPQGVTYEAASADGSKVLFASSTPLLNSDPGGATMGLYLYTDSASNPESEGKLKFITRVNDVNDEYSFSGIVNNDFVAWMSEDATHIYLYSERAPGYPKQGEYLWDSGKVHFITGLGKPIGGLLAGLSYNSVLTPIEPVSVSSDGRRLVFVRAPESAEQELLKPATGGDVVLSSIPGHPTVAVYVYDEGSETVSCVSCPSDGEPQTTNAAVQEVLPDGVLTSGTLGDDLPVNFTSRDGRFVFFTSQQPLVPQDTNGLPDVYEYDADARAVKLVSSGTGENGSWFQAASANGSDVFFLTKEKLTGWDTDTAMDLYDARINGGLAEPPVLAPPCDGDACQGVPSAVPSFSTASGFSGLGNQQPNAVAVEKSAKVKRKPAKKHRKKAHRGKARGARRRGSGVSVSNRAGR
jgi:hypothetical protein